MYLAFLIATIITTMLFQNGDARANTGGLRELLDQSIQESSAYRQQCTNYSEELQKLKLKGSQKTALFVSAQETRKAFELLRRFPQMPLSIHKGRGLENQALRDSNLRSYALEKSGALGYLCRPVFFSQYFQTLARSLRAYNFSGAQINEASLLALGHLERELSQSAIFVEILVGSLVLSEFNSLGLLQTKDHQQKRLLTLKEKIELQKSNLNKGSLELERNSGGGTAKTLWQERAAKLLVQEAQQTNRLRVEFLALVRDMQKNLEKR